MSRPTDAGNFAESAYAQMGPVAYADANLDYPLLKMLGGFGQLFQESDTIARSQDGHLPWTQLLDIDRIPDEGVAWLGQFVGVVVDRTLPMNLQRQQIRDHVGWQRGTPNALVSLIKAHLSGTQNIQVRERSPDAYTFQIATFTSETPADRTFQYFMDLSPTFTFNDVYTTWGSFRKIWELSGPNFLDGILQANKPAGLLGSVVVRGSQDFYDLWFNNPNFTAVYNEYPTFYDVWIANAPLMGITPASTYHDFTTLQQIWEAYQTFDDLYNNKQTF